MQTIAPSTPKTEQRPPPGQNRFASAIDWLCNSAIAAYALIFFLQFKIMNNIWRFKDLSFTDSAAYFTGACEGLLRWKVNFAWSPLFEFLGSLLLRVCSEPYFYCIVGRLIIVFTLSLLVLGVMRRLVSPGIALLITAWWALSPINFDAWYEVHQFAAVPIVASWLILLARNESRWARGIALGVTLLSATSVRNEHIAIVLGFALCVFVYEAMRAIRCRRDPQSNIPKESFWKVVRPYLVPISIALAITLTFYIRGTDHFPQTGSVFRVKHTTNLAQVYAYTLKQRKPGVFKGNAWTGYQDLMAKTFGATPTHEVTLLEAIHNNPTAIAEHFMWNISLIPTGIQYLLFGCISGPFSPDYGDVVHDIPRALVLTFSCLAVVLFGITRSISEWPATVEWAKQRSWALIAMAIHTPLAIFVMAMQRPRSEYLLAFEVSLLALIAVCAWRLFRPFSDRKWFTAACIIGLLVTGLAMRGYYHADLRGRKLLDYYNFLKPYTTLMSGGTGRISMPSHAMEMVCYLYGNHGPKIWSRWVEEPSLRPEIDDNEVDQAKWLRDQHVDFILLEKPDMGVPPLPALNKSKDWKLIGLRYLPGFILALYENKYLEKGMHLSN